MGEVEQDLQLPPGFRFHPTDEEIITYYLIPKAQNRTFSPRAVADVDLNKSEPWDLPGKAKMADEKEWYFYSQKGRKYPTGTRTNRATEAGYWKATGKDKEIYNSINHGAGRVLVGMKKTLVFYKGRAPRGDKTNWVMHEYRLDGKLPYPNCKKDDWVVCRVFHKTSGVKKEAMSTTSISEGFLANSSSLPNSLVDLSGCTGTDMLVAPPPLPLPNVMNQQFGNLQNGAPVSYQQVQMQMGAYGFMPPPAGLNVGYINIHGQAEQQHSSSMDTGLSSDHNAEISSSSAAAGMWTKYYTESTDRDPYIDVHYLHQPI